MFPRVPRFPRRVVFTCVYVYCLLMIHRLTDTNQATQQQKAALREDILGRAGVVRAGCSSSPPTLTKLQQHARDATHVSTNLAAYYHNLHLKAALKNIIYLPKYNLSWCLVAKVASTSWTKALLDLRGIIGDEYSDPPLQVVLRQAFRPVDPSRVNHTINTSLKFLFVRHPFQRLVSAYRNKLEDSNLQEDGAYFYKNYGSSIVQRFRKSRESVKAEKTAEVRRNNTDEKNSLRDVHENNEIKTRHRVTSDRRKQENDGEGRKMNDNFPEREREKEEDEYTEFRKEPTFEEYVDYLLNTDVDSYDEHWKPISRLCHVCEFNFDYIIKYENFKEEINYFVEMLKESGRLPTKFHLQWKNRGGTDRETTTKYLSQVSQHKRWLLYEKYYEDFLYFGYTLEDHVRL